MKKTLLLLCIIAWAATQNAQAQNCVRDSSVLLYDTVFFAPAPYTVDHPVYGLAPACIGQVYAQSMTIEVPSELNIFGNLLSLTNVSIATSGAISGLPSGITYLCDPPNCVFNANTLGCILLYGTPNNPAQAPDTTDLVINATAFTFGISIPITLPGPIAPGNYYFILAQAGNCIVGAYTLSNQISSIKNSPNPFSDATNINIVSAVTGKFDFEVFDVLGRDLYTQTVNLVEGENQFTFEAGNLPNGSYYYVISNAESKVSRLMMIAR